MDEPTMASPDLLQDAIRRASVGLLDRDALVEVLFLAAVAGEHVLVVGPPGTAKSQAVRSVARELGGSYFEYLLGRFTEPNEIFGPVDLRKLRDGVVEIETTGMLPEAEVAFIDEVFLGSTAILNTLLGILNERVFRRGSTVSQVPLRLCVGASNTMPTDPSLAAFADRFLVRVFVEPIDDSLLEDLLETTWATPTAVGPASTLSVDDLDRLREACRRCDLSAVRPTLAQAIRTLRSAGVPITDRRAVKAQSLIAAAAVLDGRSAATTADLWPLPLIVPSDSAQITAREVLSPLLDDAANRSAPAAAEQLSASRASRAQRLAAAGRALIDAHATGTAEFDRLQCESVLREIDATFSTDQLPDELAGMRERIVEIVRA